MQTKVIEKKCHKFLENILINLVDYKYDIDIGITHFVVNVIRYLANLIFNIFIILHGNFPIYQ